MRCQGYARGGDFEMGYLQSKLVADLCVDKLVRPTRISPRQSGAARPCSTLEGCEARPDRRLRTAVCSADRAESLVLQGRIIIAVHVHLCLGVRGAQHRGTV